MLFVCTSFPERSQDGVVIESGQLVRARYRTSQTAWLEDGEAGVGAFAKPHVLSAHLDVLWYAPKVLYLTELREDTFFCFGWHCSGAWCAVKASGDVRNIQIKTGL